MAATARALSGSRFLRPKLSRFFNQVAQARSRISCIVKGAAALMPPLPDVFSSRFYTKPRGPPVEAVTTPRTVSRSRFLPAKMLSRFFNQAAQPHARKSRFMKEGAAALQPPMPDIFSSRFYTKPRPPSPRATTKPPTPPRSLRPHWPHGKPRGPAR